MPSSTLTAGPTSSQMRVLPEFDDEDEEDDMAAETKKYRYRWPDEIRDEVLARLLELNRQRALEEGQVVLDADRTDSPPKTKKPATKKPKAKRERACGCANTVRQGSRRGLIHAGGNEISRCS